MKIRYDAWRVLRALRVARGDARGSRTPGLRRGGLRSGERRVERALKEGIDLHAARAPLQGAFGADGRKMSPGGAYVLTAAGRDFLPVLVMLGAWGTRHRSGGKLVRFVDAQTGRAIRPVVIDAVTQSALGSRPIKVVRPDGSTHALAPAR